MQAARCQFLGPLRPTQLTPAWETQLVSWSSLATSEGRGGGRGSALLSSWGPSKDGRTLEGVTPDSRSARTPRGPGHDPSCLAGHLGSRQPLDGFPASHSVLEQKSTASVILGHTWGPSGPLTSHLGRWRGKARALGSGWSISNSSLCYVPGGRSWGSHFWSLSLFFCL